MQNELPESSEPFDAVKELYELLGECKMTMVFWVCSDPTHRGVTWDESKVVATCQVCGKTNSQHNEQVELPPNGGSVSKKGVVGG